MTSAPPSLRLSKRGLLGGALGLAVSGFIPRPASADILFSGIDSLMESLSTNSAPDPAPVVGQKRIHLKHLHTGEELDVVFWENGAYVGDALAAVNKLLRDFRTEAQIQIDPGLLDLLSDLRQRTSTREPFRIISAYRSLETNDALRAQSEQTHGQSEVAKKSLHTLGKAIDLRLPDVALKNLAAIARGLQRGGVGYYPESDFVHVDVGAVRTWSGS
jgi:uncharacterized protein YcbK (DUF882 family)